MGGVHRLYTYTHTGAGLAGAIDISILKEKIVDFVFSLFFVFSLLRDVSFLRLFLVFIVFFYFLYTNTCCAIIFDFEFGFELVLPQSKKQLKRRMMEGRREHSH